MDNLRAMREARYEAAQKAAKGVSGKPAPAPKKAAPVAAKADPAEGDALCGHRSMNGRTCTREHGHSAKSHRYS